MFSNPELSYLLRGFAGQKLVFVPNPGNAGDSFITHATYQYFDALGLDIEIGVPTGVYPERVTIYAGGGNLISSYQNAIQFIGANHRVNKALVILPHTIAAYGEILSTLGSNCFLFCREKPSFEYVSQHVKTAKVFLAHDMAMSADIQKIRKDASAYRKSSRYLKNHFMSDIQSKLVCARHIVKTGFSSGRLYAFRTDVERTERPIPLGNFDASANFATRDFSPDGCLNATYNLLAFIDRYQSVETNRLHVSILATLLGKQVTFEGNSYFKNKAIFQQSLERRFANVRWRDS